MRIINEWGYHSHANWKTEHMGCKNMSFCVSFIICGGSTAKCQTPGETDCTQVVVSLCCWEAQDVAGMMILTPRWPMRLSLNTILSGWLHSIQYNLVRNPKFLTDNRHGSCKSRVLICNKNTPLLYSEIATLIDILLYVIFDLNGEEWIQPIQDLSSGDCDQERSRHIGFSENKQLGLWAVRA